MLSERPRGTLSETRKVTKSAMEKKRRARINTSLVELKTILGGMISHKTERFDKMEKADILEMTVTYVRQLQRKSEQLSSPVKNKDEDYKNGVNSCISEVIKYIASSNSCDDEIKAKLLDHLANRLTGVDESNVRQECKTTLSTSVDKEPKAPEPVPVQNEAPRDNSSIQTPINISTPTVSPTALTLSPGSNSNQFNFQGQFSATTLQTSPVVNALQQASPVVSNFPLTIIVPANLYPSVSGTTCVIPLNIPTTATTQIPATSEPSSNVSHIASPVTHPQNDFSRIVLGGQQQIQCVNSVSMNNTEMKSDAFRDSPETRTHKLCNNDQPNVLKENVAFQPQTCMRVHHSPVFNSLHKEQLGTEQLWRPW